MLGYKTRLRIQCANVAICEIVRKTPHRDKHDATGDPLENAVAERTHKTIKEEFTNDKQLRFCDIEEAKTEIKKFVDFYNRDRPHRSVQWPIPSKARQCTGELKRVWRSYRSKHEWGDLTEA